ncbi:MAG: hypothetical protein A2992_03815 [Elusimicrobia bacterium RIFCSPLOWO2_01_FULL_59_12]|nr:MAG: hypothetical protein A2992_03815 [Elusimicrobia bacterium RIFCSPLOWO2_01_FULL_59_12]
MTPLYAVSQSAVQAYNQGVQRLNASKFNEALPFFDQAIGRDDAFPEAFYARGVCKHRLQDPQGALSDLNQAIELKPDYLDAYTQRGVVWYEQEQSDPAYQDFDFVLKRRPNDTQALLGRGVIALRQDQLETARRDLSLFLKLRPRDPLAPEIRKVLAALPRESAEEPTPSRGQALGARPSSIDTERLTQDLFLKSKGMSEAYEQKVLRGERADAVGDIRSHPSAPK